MNVLRHALCGDDIRQTKVSIIFGEKCSKFFFVPDGFVGDATQVRDTRRAKLLRFPLGHLETINSHQKSFQPII